MHCHFWCANDHLKKVMECRGRTEAHDDPEGALPDGDDNNMPPKDTTSATTPPGATVCSYTVLYPEIVGVCGVCECLGGGGGGG